MPASTILLLEADETAWGAIADTLSRVGYQVTTVADGAEALRRARDHGLVIIDVVSGETTADELTRAIRSTPTLARIPVLCVAQSDSVEDRIAFLEAGADDVMAKPFDARELEARVEALVLRFQRSRELSPDPSLDGAGAVRRMVACYGPKGGAGTTTIAVNIAAALAARRPSRVAIIDLAQFGQVATHLNISPRQTMAEVVRDEAALREPELLHTYVAHHDAGIDILAAPSSPELGDLITAQHLELLLPTAAQTWELVIVDAGSTLDERTMIVLDRADAVILPVYPEIAALKAMHSLVDYLSETGSVVERALFVINNIFAREMLRMRDVESALGAKIALELPNDPLIYLKAVNEGIPVVRGAPRSGAAERLSKLATLATGFDLSEPIVAKGDERRGRLGGLLKRA